MSRSSSMMNNSGQGSTPYGSLSSRNWRQDFASPNSNYNEEERNENGSQGQDKRSANVKGAI